MRIGGGESREGTKKDAISASTFLSPHKAGLLPDRVGSFDLRGRGILHEAMLKLIAESMA